MPPSYPTPSRTRPLPGSPRPSLPIPANDNSRIGLPIPRRNSPPIPANDNVPRVPPPARPTRGWGPELGRLGTLLLVGEALDIIFPGSPQEIQIPAGSPWFIARDCHSGPYDCHTWYPGTTDPGGGICLPGQYSWDFDGIQPDFATYTAKDWRTVVIGKKNDQGFPQRYTTGVYLSRYWWSPGWWDPALYPHISPGQQPASVPQRRTVPDWVDPFSQPVGEPMPEPQAPPFWVIPYRQPNPWRSPNEQTETGPEPKPRSRPRPRWPRPGVPVFPEPDPTGDPVGNPDPWAPGSEIPDVTIEPGGDVSTSPAPRPNVETKPHRGNTREGKVRTKMNVILLLLRGAVNFVTEGMDFVDAIYESIPKQYREGYYRVRYYDRRRQMWREFWRGGRGSHSPQAKIRTVWNHWEDANIGDAVHNLAQNEIEDRIIGRIGQAQARATANNPYWTSPVGPHAGPADSISRDLQRDYNYRERRPSHVEMQYDPQRNVFVPVTVPGRAPRR